MKSKEGLGSPDEGSGRDKYSRPRFAQGGGQGWKRTARGLQVRPQSWDPGCLKARRQQAREACTSQRRAGTGVCNHSTGRPDPPDPQDAGQMGSRRCHRRDAPVRFREVRDAAETCSDSPHEAPLLGNVRFPWSRPPHGTQSGAKLLTVGRVQVLRPGGAWGAARGGDGCQRLRDNL